MSTKKPNGRRALRAELEASPFRRRIEWEANLATRAPMAPRHERRKKQGKNFRPVYGYVGPGATK